MTVERWEIWLANLDPVIGSEQGRTRPVLVSSSSALNNILPVFNVLPVTSCKLNRRIYPNEVLLSVGTGGLSGESIALYYQIRTLDKQRLTKKFGTITDKILQNEILDALKFQLETD